MQISNRKRQARKSPQIAFRRVLGSIWEGFGAVWGLFWALLGASGPFFGPSRSSFYKAWVQDGLQEGFWIDFGWLLEGFGRVWGRIWEGLGRILANFGMDFGEIWGRI